ncbi:MAG: methyltransferase domain-containing protein, partial [Phaeodactylibacter sp.]|nr:methyltransferase domain-containing protein [Phaeodactylibacter sp.]
DLIYTPGLEAHSYVTNFDYLRRDWSGLEESEEEITQIADHFKQLLPTDDQTELLVLGAGAGRVAWQLADDFASVIAMDNSPSMVGFFYTALQQAIPFYELNTTNCFDTAEFLRPLQAKVPTPKTDKFRMFLGDALHLPYPDQSVDAVASIFFTDMVPFAGLLEELKRVLKPGGTFIHYGPLQYHFSDLSQRLSGAEIKAELEANGFSIRTEAFWQSGHCTSAWAHLKKTYTIWGMKAEKLPAPPPVILQNDAILAIVDQLTVQRQYLLSNSPEEQLNSTELWTSDKKYEGAETIVDILSLIDGQKTIGTLFQELAGVYPDLDEAAIGQVKQILTGFVQTGVLELKTGA